VNHGGPHSRCLIRTWSSPVSTRSAAFLRETLDNHAHMQYCNTRLLTKSSDSMNKTCLVKISVMVLQIIQYNDFRKRRLLAKRIKAPELMETVF
jgi:hypothetical protein